MHIEYFYDEHIDIRYIHTDIFLLKIKKKKPADGSQL